MESITSQPGSQLPEFNLFTVAARYICALKRFDFGVFDEEDLATESFIRYAELKQTTKWRNKPLPIASVTRRVYWGMLNRHKRKAPKQLKDDDINLETFGRAQSAARIPYEDLLGRLTEEERKLYELFAELGRIDYDEARRLTGKATKTLYNQWASIQRKAHELRQQWLRPIYAAITTDPYSEQWSDLIDHGATVHEKHDLRVNLVDLWTAHNTRLYFDGANPCPILMRRADEQLALVSTDELLRTLPKFHFQRLLTDAFRSGIESQLRDVLRQMPVILKQGEPVILP